MPFVKKKYVKKSKNFVKAVQKIVNKNLETKHHEIKLDNYTIQDVARSPIDYGLFGIAQGNDNASRDGNQIQVKSIKLNGFITGADTYNNIRLLIYKSKNVVPMSTAGDAISFNGFVDKDKYIVYKDMYIPLNSTGAYTKRLGYTKLFKGSGLKVKYDGGVAADCITEWRLYAVSDSTAIADPEIDVHIEVAFKDS